MTNQWKTIERYAYLGVAMTLVILVCISSISYQSLVRIQNDFKWATNTREVLLNLSYFLSDLKDAKMGQREYLLTGQESYLKPYQYVERGVNQHFADIRIIATSNVTQQKKLDILESLVTEQLSKLKKLVSLQKNKGVEAAKQAMMTGTGKQIMDEIRTLILEIDEDERVLSDQRIIKITARVKYEAVVKGVGFILIFITSLLVTSGSRRWLMKRKKIEEMLRESEERFDLATRGSNDGIWDWPDMNGEKVWWSVRFYELLGYEDGEIEATYSNFKSLLHPDDLDRMKEAMRVHFEKHVPFYMECRFRTKSGEYCWFRSRGQALWDENGKPCRMSGSIHDITERKKAEDEKEQLQSQLRQTQKMEAIGTLAGGIAHDFNNILGALIGYADLVKDEIPEGTIAYRNQKEVLIAANRATELVKQILTFDRKDEAKLIPVQINTIVQEALKLLRSSLPTTIEINHDINCNSTIMADETQIHQVLLNLGTNAAHAMAENGGVLEVNLAEINIDSDIATRYGSLQSGSYVKLTMKDDGCGMSREIKERIFEPFYTTKEVGQGTGLGLSVVHGIVEKHNGVITVDSKPGEGTTFEIFFPCVEDREIKKTEGSQVVFGQGKQILFVDDEQSLVDMATQMLQRIGYEVIGKTNSIEALEVFQADPDKFDLVIADQTMPNMTGTELAKELMNIRPDIPIILCTGFSNSVDSESAKAVGIREFIMKPFNREEISQIIREILDRKEVTV